MPHKPFLAVAAIAGLLAAAVVPSAQATVVSGDQLYVTNGALVSGAPTVARFGIDSAGLLTPAQTEDAGSSARGMVFTPRPDAAGQRFAFIASSDTDPAGSIDRYVVSTNGALGRLDHEPVEGGPFGIAIHPDGRTLYVSLFETGTIVAYRIGLGGKLDRLSEVTTDTHPKSVAITPNGRFLYVSHGAPTDPPPGILNGFAINPDGSINPNAVAREKLGANGAAVAITPDGQYVYASSMERGDDTGDVYGFRIGSTGVLHRISDKPFQAGEWVEGIAISDDGRRLYTAGLDELGRESGQDGDITGFAIDPITGRLNDIEHLDTFGFDPIALAFGRDGKTLYVADFADDKINVLRVDAAGHLTLVQTLGSGGSNPGNQSVTVRPAIVP